MIENKRILLTGGAGFIGTVLARRLLERNEVVVLDNGHRNSLKDSGYLDHPNLTLVTGDVLNADDVSRAMSGCQLIVHLAAIAGVDTVIKMPVTTMKVGIIGTYNVLEAAIAESGVERLIDFSTSEVFGAYAYKVREGDVTSLGAVGEARWTYAVSKLATEHMAHNYHKQYGLPALSIRPFNIYGPGQVGEGAIHRFIVRALRNEPLDIHNDGSQIRAWCYVEDIADAVLTCLEEPAAVGQAFNIGNPRSICTIYHLAQQIVRLSNSASEIKFVPWNNVDVELRIPDIAKARTLLGYEPKVDLEEGLLRTIEWYRGRMGPMIRLTEPEIGDAEVAAVTAVLRSGYLVQGQAVRQFEQQVAEYVGVRHAIAVSSGTAALHLALLAAGVGPGDEVIVPDFTFPATANVVELAGATAILADIDLATFNVDPAALRGLITPRTKAIMPVHLFGLSAEMDPLLELAREHGLALIEDAACALGAEYRGRRCGGMGAINCFSFHPRKIITTGEGGMLTTDDDDLAELARRLRNHGMVPQDGRYQFLLAGFNYRLTDFQGALGVAQMVRLSGIIERRGELAALYGRALADLPLLTPPMAPAHMRHTWQSYVVMLDERVNRDRVQQSLKDQGVESTLGTYAISRQPHYQTRDWAAPNSVRAFRHSLGLPLHPRMADSDVELVVAALESALRAAED